MPLCTFLCKMARERGLADFTVWDHEIEPKTRTVPLRSLVAARCCVVDV